MINLDRNKKWPLTEFLKKFAAPKTNSLYFTKLASQFDKELSERDKGLKTYQTGLWDDIQQLF